MILQIPLDVTDEQQSFYAALVLLIEAQERRIEEMQQEIENLQRNIKN
jgi:hypothetical protein